MYYIYICIIYIYIYIYIYAFINIYNGWNDVALLVRYMYVYA
jgi:hypothetical protein